MAEKRKRSGGGLVAKTEQIKDFCHVISGLCANVHDGAQKSKDEVLMRFQPNGMTLQIAPLHTGTFIQSFWAINRFTDYQCTEIIEYWFYTDRLLDIKKKIKEDVNAITITCLLDDKEQYEGYQITGIRNESYRPMAFSCAMYAIIPLCNVILDDPKTNYMGSLSMTAEDFKKSVTFLGNSKQDTSKHVRIQVNKGKMIWESIDSTCRILDKIEPPILAVKEEAWEFMGIFWRKVLMLLCVMVDLKRPLEISFSEKLDVQFQFCLEDVNAKNSSSHFSLWVRPLGQLKKEEE